MSKKIKWLKTNLIENTYNYFAILFTLLSIGITIIFYQNKTADIVTVHGYLIAASSIYASILFAYIMQKVTKISTEKENLLKNIEIKEKFRALLYYRFLCFQIHTYYKTKKHKIHNKIESLSIEPIELNMLDNCMEDYVIVEHRVEFERFSESQEYAMDYAIIVKFSKFLSDGVMSQISLQNTIFYSNNNSINNYLNILITDGPFIRINELTTKQEDTELIRYASQQLSAHAPFHFFKNKIELSDGDILTNLRLIERYILNQVLFDLYKTTFIIEKQLPNSIICLFFNLAFILLFGTILPLMNSFFLNQDLVNISISASVTALVLSIIYLWKIFTDDNDINLHKFSDLNYEGKDINT